MNREFSIKNMNEGLDIMPDMPDQNYRMERTLQIMNRMNESANDTTNAVTCPICGATWVPEVIMEDGTTQICPACDNIVNPEAFKYTDPAVEVESVSDAKDDLEDAFDDYIDCVNCNDAEGAKAVLESADAKAIYNSVGRDLEVMLEKFVIKVDANGKKQKVKVRTGKAKKLSAKQKAALKKARKKANTGAAKKARKKAMKNRARMGLNKKVNEAMEALNNLPSADDLQSAVETILNNQGIEVISAANETSDGITAVSVSVEDPVAEVNLDDIAAELEGTIPGFDIDYDDPEVDDSDNSVDINFYFVSSEQTNESTNCKKRRMNEYDDEDDDYDNMPDEDDDVLECDDYDDMSEMKNCKRGRRRACNESFGRSRRSSFRRMNESVAGGASNIRCKIHPSFIKAGQVIYDADENTVFTALTESMDYRGNYALEVDIENSTNPKLSRLASGSEISLSSNGRYYLLKNNPNL